VDIEYNVLMNTIVAGWWLLGGDGSRGLCSSVCASQEPSQHFDINEFSWNVYSNHKGIHRVTEYVTIWLWRR
jgi:hypothetical protein